MFGMDTLLTILLCANLWILGTERIQTGIRLSAVEGFVLGALALATHGLADPHAWIMAAGSVLLKGLAFPWLLTRAVRTSGAFREAGSFAGQSLSVLFGVVAAAAGVWVKTRLPVPLTAPSTLLEPVALSMILCGVFFIATRRNAVSQVVGYIMLENGVYVFGVGAVRGMPVLVELGVLLDVLAAVFIMGLLVLHISREFHHVDVGRLAELRD